MDRIEGWPAAVPRIENPRSILLFIRGKVKDELGTYLWQCPHATRKLV